MYYILYVYILYIYIIYVLYIWHSRGKALATDFNIFRPKASSVKLNFFTYIYIYIYIYIYM